jgi:hypothetical protein
MENKKLEAGEKYLRVLISEGGVDRTYSVFLNKDRTAENQQPHFRCGSINSSIAVWVNKKKDPAVVVNKIVEDVI